MFFSIRSKNFYATVLSFSFPLTHIDNVSSLLREVAESKTYGLYFTAPVINPSI